MHEQMFRIYNNNSEIYNVIFPHTVDNNLYVFKSTYSDPFGIQHTYFVNFLTGQVMTGRQGTIRGSTDRTSGKDGLS